MWWVWVWDDYEGKVEGEDEGEEDGERVRAIASQTREESSSRRAICVDGGLWILDWHVICGMWSVVCSCFASLPADFSTADTSRMPSALIEKETSIWGREVEG